MDGFAHFRGGVGAELGQANVADRGCAVLGPLAEAHRMQLNAGPLDRVSHGAIAPLQGQHHRGSHRAANQLHGLVNIHPLGGFAVNAQDFILRQNARLGRRGAIDRGNNDQFLGFLVFTQLQSHPRQFTGGVDLHVAELIGIHEASVRIAEFFQHFPNRFVGRFGLGIVAVQIILAHRLPVHLVEGAIHIEPIDNLPNLVNHFLRVFLEESMTLRKVNARACQSHSSHRCGRRT